MYSLNAEMTKALFLLSQFETDSADEKAGQEDLNRWINFFSLAEFDSPDTALVRKSQASATELRADIPAESLSVNEVKAFSPRFLDGFIALPGAKGSEVTGGS